MGKNKNTTTEQLAISGMEEFDALAGDEVFTDRPIVKFEELGADARPVVGFLVCEDELNLPANAKRPDNRKTWDAFVVHLTKPTNVVNRDGVITEIKAGAEVFIPVNPKIAHLRTLLGKAVMYEVALMGDGMIETANNPMQAFRIKILAGTKARTGSFLIGGPGQEKLLKSGVASTLDAFLGELGESNGSVAAPAAGAATPGVP